MRKKHSNNLTTSILKVLILALLLAIVLISCLELYAKNNRSIDLDNSTVIIKSKPKTVLENPPSQQTTTPAETPATLKDSTYTACNFDVKAQYYADYQNQISLENARYETEVNNFLLTNPDPSVKAQVIKSFYDEHAGKISEINNSYYAKLASINCN